MRNDLLVLLVVSLGIGCASSAPAPAVRSVAHVTVSSVSPVAATVLDEASVIDATVEYSIENFQVAKDRYYLTIQFDKAGGGSFNHYHRFSEEPNLSAPQGTVHVTYALSQVWQDSRLKRPIRVSFYLIERTAANDSLVIGQAGPIEYATK